MTETPELLTITAPDLFRRADGRLMLRRLEEGNAVETPVQVVYCFPWSHARRYVSLRDDKGKELALLDDLDAVEQPARQLLEDELARRNFIPTVTAITRIDNQGELSFWEVRTTAGLRHFFTSKNDAIRKLTTQKLLVIDVGKDLYLIENHQQMDEKSCELLWRYLD